MNGVQGASGVDIDCRNEEVERRFEFGACYYAIKRNQLYCYWELKR